MAIRCGGTTKGVSFVLRAACVLLLSAGAASAAMWHYLSGGKLSGISSVGSHVWTVGQDGLFFYSEDNGAIWRRVPRFTTRNLVDVEFWDQSFGLVTAEDDIVYRTTNNGASWDSTHVAYAGGKIRFITGNRAWIMSQVRALASTDAGRTWILKSDGRRNPWFLDSLNGWADYDGGHSARTCDGGAHWSQQGEMPRPGYIGAFGFLDSSNGICAYAYWVSIRYGYWQYNWVSTQNGGSDWSALVSSLVPYVCSDVDADGHALGLSRSWCLMYTPDGSSSTYFGNGHQLYDISAARGDHPWICGVGSERMYSPDSGVTWLVGGARSCDSLQNLEFVDSLNGWAATDDQVVRTTDGGYSWNLATDPGIGTITDIAAHSESIALIVSGWSAWDMEHGWIGRLSLFRTTDCGAVWDTIRDFWVGDGYFGSSRIAHVGQHDWHPGTRSPNCNSLRSTDAGATWSDMPSFGTPGVDPEPPDICFTDTLNGWAIDSRSSIRYTSDGGETWLTIAESVGVKRLQMVNGITGWAISDSGVLTTADGGYTWQSALRASGLQAVHFSDTRHGAIVGLDGLILSTSDGGLNWSRDTCEFTSDLYTVFMLDSAHAWAAGENGLVLGFGDWAVGADERQSPQSGRVSELRVEPSVCRTRLTVYLSGGPAKVQVHDLSGRMVSSFAVKTGDREVAIDIRELPSGVYYVSSLSALGRKSCRVVKVK